MLTCHRRQCTARQSVRDSARHGNPSATARGASVGEFSILQHAANLLALKGATSGMIDPQSNGHGPASPATLARRTGEQESVLAWPHQFSASHQSWRVTLADQHTGAGECSSAPPVFAVWQAGGGRFQECGPLRARKILDTWATSDSSGASGVDDLAPLWPRVTSSIYELNWSAGESPANATPSECESPSRVPLSLERLVRRCAADGAGL